MTFLQRSQFVVLVLLCGCSVTVAQGSQGAGGQSPPAQMPRPVPIKPLPAPMSAPPPVPVPPAPQSTEAGNGESAPSAKSGTAPPANAAPAPARKNIGAPGQAAAEKLSLAGCIVADEGHYELVQASGNRFVLTGKTNNLRAGSAVELEGFLREMQRSAPAMVDGWYTVTPVFAVTSISLLSHSCAIRGAHATATPGILGAITGQATQGTAGEPPGGSKRTGTAFPLRSSSSTQLKPSEPTHFQTALVALKKARQELTVAKAQAGSQGDLALRTVQVAIDHLELAAKDQK